jgi:predicted nuclease with TOPRIM domain
MEDLKTDSYATGTPKKDNRNIIYTVLAVALLGTWGYMIFDKSKTREQVAGLTTQNTQVTSERDQVKELYNASLARLDSLMGENQSMSDSLDTRNGEISKLRSDIRKLLNKKNATDADLAQARAKINELNSKINSLAGEVKRLEGENKQLAESNQQITQEKQKVESDLATTQSEKQAIQKNLDETVDVASTLKASNINIFALNEKSSGKEKETTSAKKADKLRITFDLDENRIAKSGEKEIYIAVTGPDGKAISNNTTFATREEGEKPYTSKVAVQYENGKKTPVSFDWRSDKGFATGDYKIEIYHNGFKIGEGVRSLKKGGLF